MKQLGLLINGEIRQSSNGATFESVNPYTGETWREVPAATAEDVRRAAQAAEDAFHDWSRRPAVQRANLLLRLADLLEARADEFAEAESRDNGKVIRETRPQMSFAARQYRYYAGWADKAGGSIVPMDTPNTLDLAARVPVGPVGQITAWNSPIGHMSNKLAPALAAGCTTVLKPSEHASVTTLMFAELLLEAGFPPGVVNLVTGGPEVGDAIVRDESLRLISFTGSPGVGASIAATAAARLVPTLMELGGKSANIVFEDADIERASIGAMAGIFAAAGQTCIAGSRLLVHRSIKDELVERILARVGAIKLGDPRDPATEMGPVATKSQYEHVTTMYERALQEGAHSETGGLTDNVPGHGYFVRPTVISGVTPEAHLASEEVFGPVLAVMEFETEEEAIQLANATRFGLAAGVWTTDLNRAMRVSQSMMAGSVWVNTYRQIGVQAPFGGFKDSGYGRERGREGLESYLTTRNIMFNYDTDVRDPFSIKV